MTLSKSACQDSRIVVLDPSGPQRVWCKSAELVKPQFSHPVLATRRTCIRDQKYLEDDGEDDHRSILPSTELAEY